MYFVFECENIISFYFTPCNPPFHPASVKGVKNRIMNDIHLLCYYCELAYYVKNTTVLSNKDMLLRKY
uniref:Uncharacterized protein n=1 Tax=Anguilla anguilla TaxID=7936 RepID=A0A0E9R077_ANGAN